MRSYTSKSYQSLCLTFNDLLTPLCHIALYIWLSLHISVSRPASIACFILSVCVWITNNICIYLRTLWMYAATNMMCSFSGWENVHIIYVAFSWLRDFQLVERPAYFSQPGWETFSWLRECKLVSQPACVHSLVAQPFVRWYAAGLSTSFCMMCRFSEPACVWSVHSLNQLKQQCHTHTSKISAKYLILNVAIVLNICNCIQ